ncbi:MAG: cbb3-type cytochrome c oxidase subunit I, partial [Armatimonadota bacterium]
MAVSAVFRTCPETGLRVHSHAETLIKVNAVAGILFLAWGGLFGLLVALTRWPAVHLLPAEMFYQALTVHGVNVLLFWIIFFEMAILYFASAVLLNSRLATPLFAWAAFVLMVVGAVMTNVAMLQGKSTVMYTSYVPMQAAPHFYLGLVLFAVGALIACFVFFGTLVVAKDERTYEGSVPLVTFGAITAAIIAVFTVASGAVILIPTFLWSIGLIGHLDSLMYKLIWWGMGHASQQVNVSAHVAVWYGIAAMVLGAKPLSEKVSRSAFLLYILFLQLASAHHLLVEPAISSSFKVFNTSYAIYLAVLGSLIHGMSVPGAVEAAQRRRGFTRGAFEWLRNAPWGNPAFAGLAMSVVMFGFLGGISGVVIGTEQLNLIMHNTMYAPGHFHGTVVAGTTLAFMGLTYLVIPLIFRREIILKKWAQWQPYLFGIGVAGISLFMMGAGTLGVARRHWDITFSDSLLSFDYPATAFLMLGLNGLF